MTESAPVTLKMQKQGTKRRPDLGQPNLRKQLETPKSSPVAVAGAALSKSAQDRDATNAVQIAGGVGSLAGAGGILNSARGKATPSILDLGYQFWQSSDTSTKLLKQLAEAGVPAAELELLEKLAVKSPLMFKAVLAGIPVRGVAKQTQQTLREAIFSSLVTNPGRAEQLATQAPAAVRPVGDLPGIPRIGQGIPRIGAGIPQRDKIPTKRSPPPVSKSIRETVTPSVGDVNVYAYPNELTTPYGRMQHVLTGQPSHSAIRGREGYWETSGDIGRNLTKDRLQILLRSKKPVDPESIQRGISAIQQPYNTQQFQRTKAHELFSPVNTDRTKPTFSEHIFGRIAKAPDLRKQLGDLPLIGPQLKRMLRNYAGQAKNCKGGICSSAVTDVLQQADPTIMGGRKPLEISPADFLRRTGKDFDVAGMSVPKNLQATKQLVLNHLMKAGPWASRAAVAAPLLAGGGYLLNKGLRKPERKFDMGELIGRMKEKFAASYAPGLPNKHVYGEPTRDLKPGQLADYVLQKHETARNPTRPHFDMRIGSPATNLFSWAIPGAELPEEGKKKLAPQTQLHTFAYGNFEGPIREGYGAGYVSRQDQGQVMIRKVQPNAIHFTIAHTKVPVRYALIRIGGKDGRDWLLVHKAQPKTVEGVGDKPKYKLIEANSLDDAIDRATEVQEKIDGAHQIYQVGTGGEVESYSVNPRKTGEPIVHTERTGLTGVKGPEALKGTTLRGEAYATGPTGKAIPFQEVSGLLNATIAKATEMRRVKKLKMRHAIFDVIRHKGQDVSKLPLAERQKLVREIVGQLPKEHFHTPLSATEAEDKAKLFDDIRTGKNPRTSEGIMLHTPENKVLKYKLRPESRGYVTGVFPGKAGRIGLPGGVTFSETPGGEEQGRLGSGFTVDELKEIAKSPEAYKTRPMRITHMGKFPAGTLRAPVFSGWETDVKEAASKLRSMLKVLPAEGASAIQRVMAGNTPVGRVLLSPERDKLLGINIAPKFRGLGLGRKLHVDLAKESPTGRLLSHEHLSDASVRVWEGLKRRYPDLARQLRASVRTPASSSHPEMFPAVTSPKNINSAAEATIYEMRSPLQRVKEAQQARARYRGDVSPQPAPVPQQAPGAIPLPGYVKMLAPNIDIPAKLPVQGLTTNLSANVSKQLGDSLRMQLIGADKEVAQSNKGLTEFYSKVNPKVQQQMDQAVSKYVTPHAGQSVNAAEFGPDFLASMQKAVPGLDKVAPYITKGQGAAAAQQFTAGQQPAPKVAPQPVPRATPPTAATQPRTPAPVQKQGSVMQLLKQAVIKHEGKKWTLYTHDGSRVLGRHGSEAEAKAQERAIQYSKAQKAASFKFASSPLVRSLLKQALTTNTTPQAGYASKPYADSPNANATMVTSPMDPSRKGSPAAALSQAPRSPVGTPGPTASTVALPGTGTVPPTEVNQDASFRNLQMRTAPQGQPNATLEGT